MAIDKSHELNLNTDSSDVHVPVFNCIVYVDSVAGGIRAQVVNLAGIEFTAANERAALAQIVPAFKQRMVELLQAGEQVPWIDPVRSLNEGEQQRLIPVHL